MKKFVRNIPNLLSILRLFSVPVLIYLAAGRHERPFFILWLIAVTTDALDGWIARMFRLQTPLGAKLDSTADTLLYLATLAGIYWLKWDDFGPYKTQAIIIVAYILAVDVFSLVKFGRISSLHLYSWKIGGVLQSLFVFWLFWKGFEARFFQLVFWWTTLAFAENILIQSLMRTYGSNMRNLFWFYRNIYHKRI